MEAADPHVVNPVHGAAEILGGLGRFLRHGDIRRAGGAHRDAPPMGLVLLLNLDDPGDGVVGRLGEVFLDQPGLLRRCPGPQDLAILLVQPAEDRQQMAVRLARAEDDLREAGAHLAVGIQLGVAHFLEGLPSELALGFLHRHRPVLNLFQ